MLSGRLLVSSRLLVVKVFGSQNLYTGFGRWGGGGGGVSVPNALVVQGSHG